MEIFLTLLIKIIPLYIFILLGFIAGKYLQVKKESIAPILIYIMLPVIFFNGGLTTKISSDTLSLPILFLLISSVVCLLFFYISRFIWKDSTRNILASAAGDGNTGYFGIPVALILFNETLFGIYLLCILGVNIYENSLGFFIVAKGNHTLKESIFKTLKLPMLYGFILGLLLQVFGFHFGSSYVDAVVNIRGTYTVLGMMIIGLGLSSIASFKLDLKFIGLSFLARFLIWPLLTLSIIAADYFFFKLYDPNIYKVMLLVAIVPLAGTTVTFATELKTHPEKAAVAVFLSTLFALLYIPLIAAVFLK